MKTHKITIILTLCTILLVSCGDKSKKMEIPAEAEMASDQPVYNTEDPQTILAAIEYAHGGWNDLWKKRDVTYTYDYRNPALGKADVSTERYIFANEVSFGLYEQHEINVMPETQGKVEQYFNGLETIVMLDGDKVEDPQVVGTGDFLRRANYFWFLMPYKLNDSGTIASYMGQEEYNGTLYDKLHITYDSEITGKDLNDTYILYVNPATKVIDRFYFSLPNLGVNDPVLIAHYEYEDIEGQLLATKRTYFMPDEKGTYSEEPSLVQTLTNIHFNNGFTLQNIMEVN